jgi:hypothetical protein
MVCYKTLTRKPIKNVTDGQAGSPEAEVKGGDQTGKCVPDEMFVGELQNGRLAISGRSDYSSAVAPPHRNHHFTTSVQGLENAVETTGQKEQADIT